MKVLKINQNNTIYRNQKTFGNNEEKKDRKNIVERAIDSFSTGIKVNSDMNDTISVPRTIFKGYLAFTASTALGMAAGLAKKAETASKILSFSSCAVALIGTYFFVRPYIYNFDVKKPEEKKVEKPKSELEIVNTEEKKAEEPKTTSEGTKPEDNKN